MELCSYCLGEAVLSYYDDDLGVTTDEPCPHCMGFAWTKRRVLDLIDPKQISRPKYSGPSIEDVIKKEIAFLIAYKARLAAKQQKE
jgi:hypothetical protein